MLIITFLIIIALIIFTIYLMKQPRIVSWLGNAVTFSKKDVASKEQEEPSEKQVIQAIDN